MLTEIFMKNSYVLFKNLMRRVVLFCFPFPEEHLFLFHWEDKLLTNYLNQWALFYIFANFCNVWLYRGHWDFHTCFCIRSVSLEVQEENLA